MYEKKDKRRLYWLIEQFLSEKISASTFCDEFYYSYDLEIDHKTLSATERVAFKELGEVSSRYSQYDEDHNLDRMAFTTTEQLKQKAIETKHKLDI
jgi:hypothetical protein